jgi:hypothetical protein
MKKQLTLSGFDAYAVGENSVLFVTYLKNYSQHLVMVRQKGEQIYCKDTTWQLQTVPKFVIFKEVNYAYVNPLKSARKRL